MLAELCVLAVGLTTAGLTIQLLRLLRADCDLTLQWASLFGKSPAALRGKVVWITGASSGIGEALAYELARCGCHLILSARRENLLHKVKQKCLEFGTVRKEDILVLPLDLVQFDSHKAVVETATKYFKKIDILVCNAGRSQRALWTETELEVDRQMLEVNTLGPLSLTKALQPHFTQHRAGHCVVVSSLMGKFGVPGMGSYSGSKHALHGFFSTLRIEEEMNNIKVTMVCPGPVHSELLRHAFTGTAGQTLGEEAGPGEPRMTAERCAHLMAVAIANELPEVWVSIKPALLLCYLAQYCPSLFTRLIVKIGGERARKMKAGIKNPY